MQTPDERRTTRMPDTPGGDGPERRPSPVERGRCQTGECMIEQAYDGLEREAPGFLARWVHRLRQPEKRRARIVAGVLLIVASFFWFLPVIGIEFLPLGLLFIAHEVPFLRKPVGRFMIWLEDRSAAVRRWWQMRHERRRAHGHHGHHG